MLLRSIITFFCLISVQFSYGERIVFVGNSFTYGPNNFQKDTVTELIEPVKRGGVPALFKALANEGGKDPEVFHCMAPGKSLHWHLENHSDKLFQPWDGAVLQEWSQGPVPQLSSYGPYFNKSVARFAKGMREQNPEIAIFLNETWARPDIIMKGKFEKLEDMQAVLQDSYSKVAKKNDLAGWAPVGDAFLLAVEKGISDDPSTTDSVEGPINVWRDDNYHQSPVGGYLSAMVIYTKFYNADPRELPVGKGSVVEKLNIDPDIARQLQVVAYEAVKAQPKP